MSARRPLDDHATALSRRDFMALTAASAALASGALPATARADVPAAESARALPHREDALFEQSVRALGAMMSRGELSSRALTERYLQRIDAMDKRGPAINAVIELNPDAVGIATALDAERKAG